jgi:hypothetical protein
LRCSCRRCRRLIADAPRKVSCGFFVNTLLAIDAAAAGFRAARFHLQEIINLNN